MEERIHGVAPDCRRIAWNSSFGFDMAVKAWGQLTMGRTVYLLPEATRLSADGMLGFIERHRIEAMEGTPSHLRMMLAGGLLQGRASSLRKLLLGGEAIDPGTWEMLAAARDTAFFNMYGPTECSVDASCGPITGPAPNVGSVMPNARIYILDPNRQPVGEGIVGEIYIGGAGVARGYLKRPELTEQRFVPDPFGDEPGARLYRTGDLGRWRAGGTIEYLGRNDEQVKIRGFRIELGEIEAQLAKHPQVKEATVVARECVPGELRLVAYVTQGSGERIGAQVLRSHLESVLPEHMIPGAFVTLESLPLTRNGKVDRRRLPEPDPDSLVSREYAAPDGEIEEAIAGIWSELLHVERVGRHDNFFELGGHSLLVTRLISRILDLLHVELPLRAVFEAPVMAHLAVRVKAEVEGLAVRDAAPGELSGALRTEIAGMQDEAVLARIAQLEKELGLCAQ
jgi:acyl-coenzyme A synthetase/AMP-(fatty) acid ligase